MPSTLYNFVTSIKRNIIVFVLLEQVIRRHFVTFNENTLEEKEKLNNHYFTLSKKKNTILSIFSIENTEDSDFCSFLGRMEDTIICFRDCLKDYFHFEMVQNSGNPNAHYYSTRLNLKKMGPLDGRTNRAQPSRPILKKMQKWHFLTPERNLPFCDFIQNLSQALSKCLSKWIKVNKWDYFKSPSQELEFSFCLGFLWIPRKTERHNLRDPIFLRFNLVKWLGLQMLFSTEFLKVNNALKHIYGQLCKYLLLQVKGRTL